ncbi:MAG: ABC transporter permease [Planctomycetes bacterium]|nr:ABC transporter permease [Planctomycetota bacterium]
MKDRVASQYHLRDYSMILFLIILFTVSSLLVPRFFTQGNLMNVATQIAINALLATGMTYVILIGGIDLSVGAVAGLSGIISTAIALEMQDISVAGSVFLCVAVALVIGTLCGLFTAFFVTKLRVPPFIATLAVNNIARGLAFVYTRSKPIYGLPDSFKWLGLEKIGPVPIMVIIMVVVLFIAHWFLTRTRSGRYIYAVGSNEEVSKLSGIRVNLVKVQVYLICSILAAFAGACYASRLQAGQPNAGQGYELTAIAAVAMGGTSMAGGSGGIFQTMLGILVIGIINNAMNLLSVSSYWQMVVMGVIILIAVVSDTGRGKV